MSPLFPLIGLLCMGETYGYELKRRIDAEFAPYWRIDFAQLYRSLAKLKTRGLVQVRVTAGEEGPERKLYRVTARGRTAFEGWIREPATTTDEFWVKLRLAARLAFDVDGLIVAERERLRAESQPPRRAVNGAAETAELARWLMEEAARQRGFAERDAVELTASVIGARAQDEPKRQALPLLIAGSDDPLLAQLGQLVHATMHVMGSTAGLDALAQQEAEVAGTHLRDPERHVYNVAFVQQHLPEEDVLLMNLAVREYGLLIAPGNPKRIGRVRDLARSEVRLINRMRGAGARLWLGQYLAAERIDPTALPGWTRTALTYDGMASAIAVGTADVGPGLRATAVKWGLEFVPLGEEAFDLVMPRRVYESARGEQLLAGLHSREFRTRAATLAGYDLHRSGRVSAHIQFGTSRKS